MSTTKLQNEIVNATSMLMKGIDALENITRLAIDEGKAKPNQSDWIYLGNHISVYVNYQLQKKVEELTEKAHEANAQAEAIITKQAQRSITVRMKNVIPL